MGTVASQITSLTIVYSTVYSDTDQRKHQNPASLAFVRGIHRWPVNSPHKWPVTRKMFPFDDVIMGFVNWNTCAFLFKEMIWCINGMWQYLRGVALQRIPNVIAFSNSCFVVLWCGLVAVHSLPISYDCLCAYQTILNIQLENTPTEFTKNKSYKPKQRNANQNRMHIVQATRYWSTNCRHIYSLALLHVRNDSDFECTIFFNSWYRIVALVHPAKLLLCESNRTSLMI